MHKIILMLDIKIHRDDAAFNTQLTSKVTHTHIVAVKVTHETCDHVWDTLRTCGCMRVRAGMRSRVAQAGRQANITNRAQMMTTGMSAGLTLLVLANTVSITDPNKCDKPWESEFRIHWYPLLSSWTKSSGEQFVYLENIVWKYKIILQIHFRINGKWDFENCVMRQLKATLRLRVHSLEIELWPKKAHHKVHLLDVSEAFGHISLIKVAVLFFVMRISCQNAL